MVKSKLTPRQKRWLAVGEYAALGAAAAILLVFLASTLDGTLVRNGQGAAVVTAVLVDLANTDRESNHVADLTLNPTLTAIAQSKANDMAAKSYFAHNSPDGHDPWYWFQLGGYKFSFAGENLAVDFSDSADVERAWMNSPTHRANLLNAHFTEIGIATAVGTYQGHQTTFVVQEFGTPAHTVAVAAPVEVTPHTEAPTEIAIATTEPKPVVVRPTPTPAAKPAQETATTAPEATPVQLAIASTTPSAVLGTNVTGISNPEPEGLAAIWNVFAASPRTTLRYAYYLFGLLILIALVIETGIEFKRHHMKHVYVALALIVLMGGLFLAADKMVFTNPQINEAGAVAQGT